MTGAGVPIPDEVITAAVRTVAEALETYEWDPSVKRGRSAHRNHNFEPACAVCDEDVNAVASLAVTVATPLVVAAELEALSGRIERLCPTPGAVHVGNVCDVAYQHAAAIIRARVDELREAAK